MSYFQVFFLFLFCFGGVLFLFCLMRMLYFILKVTDYAHELKTAVLKYGQEYADLSNFRADTGRCWLLKEKSSDGKIFGEELYRIEKIESLRQICVNYYQKQMKAALCCAAVFILFFGWIFFKIAKNQ